MSPLRWLLAAALLATGPLKLPKPIALPISEVSPGQVTFDHDTHVDAAFPSCTRCHPRLFRIVTQSAATKRPPIAHAEMEKGGACGACHDGKAAFDLTTCELCHQEPKQGATP